MSSLCSSAVRHSRRVAASAASANAAKNSAVGSNAAIASSSSSTTSSTSQVISSSSSSYFFTPQLTSALSARCQSVLSHSLRSSVRCFSSSRAFSSSSPSSSSSLSSPSPSSSPSSPSSSAVKLFDKILVANRGEITCRVFRTCQKLGIKTVAIYSEADKNAVHVQMADEAVCVGPPPTNQSYLSIQNIVEACKKTGAQAVHPGYGFLSENKDFQAALQAIGVKFIGPGTEPITAMGTKLSAKRIAKEAHCNFIPAYFGKVSTDEEVLKIANEIGYPVMIKANSGGGGKGMRIAYNDKEAVEGFRLSSAEAKSSFGDDTMFIEKYIEKPRHIEVQLLADQYGNAVYLNERECSIQRRNQKVIEEAPSSFLDPETRRKMGEQAVRLAKAVRYESAGTCEFLVDKNKNFYFLEMNTRLQVEHPVTECITGFDLVEEMIRIAAGQPLRMKQEDVKINGWAVEARVYAEDPLRGFLPSIGTLTRYQEPKGKNVRIDSGIREGSEISIHYDPMISKLITFGKDRNEALLHMRKALDSYVIRGVTHNINFLRSLCDHPRWIAGDLSTAFIPEEYPQGYKGAKLSDEEKDAILAVSLLIKSRTALTALAITGQLPSFDVLGSHHKRIAQQVLVFDKITYRAHIKEVKVSPFTANQELIIELSAEGGATKTLQASADYVRGNFVLSAVVNGREYTMQVFDAKESTQKIQIQYAGTIFSVETYSPREFDLQRFMPAKEQLDSSKIVASPMPGVVYSIAVKAGDEVAPGQEVCVVEAMKMQNALRASNGGKVKAVHVKKGQTVQADQLLVEFA